MLHDVFICHASEDKEEFVRPLADALRSNHVEVWYDEFTVNVGDSLCEAMGSGPENGFENPVSVKFGGAVDAHPTATRQISSPAATLNRLMNVPPSLRSGIGIIKDLFDRAGKYQRPR